MKECRFGKVDKILKIIEVLLGENQKGLEILVTQYIKQFLASNKMNYMKELSVYQLFTDYEV